MKRSSVLLVALLALGLVSGCGPAAPPPISVSLSPGTAQAIDQGQTLNLTATVANESTAAGVAWTVSGGGTLTATTTAAATFNAPASGATNITATVTATSIADATKLASVNIVVSPPPVITTTTLPDGTEFTVYATGTAVQASGGAGTLTFTRTAGTFPAGLTLATNGNITGTPTGPNGTANFTVTVTDSSNATHMTATHDFSILINLPPAPVIHPTSLPDGTEGSPYSEVMTLSPGHGPYTWDFALGSLPAGLTGTANSGGTTFTIAGTPTGPAGAVSFILRLTDSSNPPQQATQPLSITVNLPPPPSITTASLPDGNVGTHYSQTIAATGGLTPYSFSLASGTLPTGLALTTSSNQGVLSGIPTATGTFVFSIRVTDSSNPAQSATSLDYSVVISGPLPLSITTPSPMTGGTYNVAYNHTVSATGGVQPYTFTHTAGSLPPGLTLGTDGAITGAPTNTGTFDFTVQVTDSQSSPATATKDLSITVTAPTLSITTTSLPNGTVNTPYSQTVSATGGIPPYAFAQTAGSLPDGLSLGSDGAITGTPTTAGVSNFTVQVTDSQSVPATATKDLSITIVVPGVHNSYLSGRYVISFSGFDDNGEQTMIGTFTADGAGVVTAGSADINDSDGPTSVTVSDGTYWVDADNRGGMTLNVSGGGSVTFRFALHTIVSNVAQKGRAIEFDDGAWVSGVIEKPSPSTGFTLATLTGSYAFGLSGEGGSGDRFAVAGRLTMDGAGGVSAGVEDDNSGGTVENSAFTGTYTVDATTGRGVLTTIAGARTTHTIMYVVSANEVLLMGGDAVSADGVLISGQALKQSGTFTNSSVAGTSVFYLTGRSAGGTLVDAGLFTGTAPSSFSANLDENDGGDINVGQTDSGTYTVTSNGRVVLTSGGGGAPIIYLVSQNKGFMVGTGNSAESGFAEPRMAGPFSNNSVSGDFSFGSIDPASPDITDNCGRVQVDGAGGVSGIEDRNTSGSLEADNTFSDTYSVNATTGRAQLNNSAFFIISATKAVLIDLQDGNEGAISIIEKQ